MRTAFRWIPALLLFSAACSDTGTGPLDPDRTPARLVIVDPGVVRDGDVITLRAEARTEDGRLVTGVPMQWASVDPSVATVTPAGLLTALREGQTELVVTSGTLQQRRTLAVTLHPAVSLEVSPTNIELVIGQRGGVAPILRGLDGRQLLNRVITLESSNENVLRIGSAQELIPLAPGTVTVTARYGTLSATTRVSVRAPALVTTFAVRNIDGQSLPAVVHEELRSDNGAVRISDVTRIETGTIAIDGANYEVSLRVVHYERVEQLGAISERVISRQTLRDVGRVTYDWFTGVGMFQSTLVGGLTHVLDSDANGLNLRFREGGTTTVWRLGLALQ